jgi:serine/threonine-protein kinase
VLGQGGFGITYLGGEAALDRPVAIKELFPQGCTRQGTTVHPSGTVTPADFHADKERFIQEARVLAKFHHRGIVQVYAFFEENSTAYIVMEFVKGETLQELVETRGPLPEKEVVNYITQAADALSAVHEAGLLHRDIKPENLMLTDDGRVVLVDFGTARAFASGKAKHMTAMLTRGYAPPEQYVEDAKFGPFTDIYALGATCYHLLTGQIPVQPMERYRNVELHSPHELNHEVSQTVSDAVMRAMEMKADQRPQSAQDFIKALTGVRQAGTGHTRTGHADADQVAGGQTGTGQTGARGKAGHGAPVPDGQGKNPYESRITQLVDELSEPITPPPSVYDARIADTSRRLALCAAYHVQGPNHCPGCKNASLEEVTGQFTGNCPICRAGKLMKRKLDPDKCPVCRAGQLEKHQRERPLIFCPICRTMPLREESRKRLGILTEAWWVCDHCKAELDLGVLKQSAKLVRHEQDPFGIAAKYAGQNLPVGFWSRISPQCGVTKSCSMCGAAFYEFRNTLAI